MTDALETSWRAASVSAHLAFETRDRLLSCRGRLLSGLCPCWGTSQLRPPPRGAPRGEGILRLAPRGCLVDACVVPSSPPCIHCAPCGGSTPALSRCVRAPRLPEKGSLVLGMAARCDCLAASASPHHRPPSVPWQALASADLRRAPTFAARPPAPEGGGSVACAGLATPAPLRSPRGWPRPLACARCRDAGPAGYATLDGWSPLPCRLRCLAPHRSASRCLAAPEEFVSLTRDCGKPPSLRSSALHEVKSRSLVHPLPSCPGGLGLGLWAATTPSRAGEDVLQVLFVRQRSVPGDRARRYVDAAVFQSLVGIVYG